MTNEAGGAIDVENGSALTINGNVTNTSTGVDRGIITGFLGTGGNTLDITGTLDNTSNGNLQLLGSGDKATIGSLTNAGFVDVEGGSTLTVTGDVMNTGGGSIDGIFTSSHGSGHNTLNIGGMLTNVGGNFILYGPGDLAMVGSMSNDFNSFVDVDGGSKLTVTGNVDNFAGGLNGLYTSYYGTGGNTLTIGGMLTNEATGTFQLLGPKDTATIGSLNNAGFVDVEGGSTLTILGDVTNSGAGAERPLHQF